MQLRSLAFVAPCLASEEWACLLRLSGLTELRINDWASGDGGGGGGGGGLSPPSQGGAEGGPSRGFDLRVMSVSGFGTTGSSGTTGGSAAWPVPEAEAGSVGRYLEYIVNTVGGGPSASSSSAAAALAAAAGGEAAVTRGEVPQLGPAFPHLRTLRACLLDPAQLAVGLSPTAAVAGGSPLLPASLRSLHLVFTDDAAHHGAGGQSPWQLPGGGRMTLVTAPGSVAATEEEEEKAGEAASLASSEWFWSGLVSCCPLLTDLNIRRTWTLPLTDKALCCLVEGLPRLTALQYCGDVRFPACSKGSGKGAGARTASQQYSDGEVAGGTGCLMHLHALHSLGVLALGSVAGPSLVVRTSQLPPQLSCLSLLNAVIIDDSGWPDGCGEEAAVSLLHGRSSCGTSGNGGSTSGDGVDDTSTDRVGEHAASLPRGLRMLQLKLCDWRQGGVKVAGDDASERGRPGRSDTHAMLYALTLSCTGLTELRLSLCKTNDHEGHHCRDDATPELRNLPPLPFSLLARLRGLACLDLHLSDMPADYPFAQLVTQVASLTALKQLHLCALGLNLQGGGGLGPPEQPTCDDFAASDSSSSRKGETDPCLPQGGKASVVTGPSSGTAPGGDVSLQCALVQEGEIPLQCTLADEGGVSLPEGAPPLGPQLEGVSLQCALAEEGRLGQVEGEVSLQCALGQLVQLVQLQRLKLEPLSLGMARKLEALLVRGLPNCRCVCAWGEGGNGTSACLGRGCNFFRVVQHGKTTSFSLPPDYRSVCL